MNLENKRIGFAMTASFCSFEKAVGQIEALKKEKCDVIPVMSETAYSTDTRFGKAQDFINEIEKITGNEVIHTIKGAEPIGPSKLFDILIICPCTGNTMAKLAARCIVM